VMSRDICREPRHLPVRLEDVNRLY